jgi:hypothetical protein
MEETDVIRRAYQIAPECRSLVEVRRRLIDEGYTQVNAHLAGRLIRREILARLKA